MDRLLTFSQAINDALVHCMTSDPNVFVIGLGVPDPKAIFGTTLGLAEQFGQNRVLDMPCAENGMTGVTIGAAISGLRPVMVHQRIDFFLLAMEQIINQAAKWNYMFGGTSTVPLVVRLLVGRGWGQGPQHSQSLHSLFAHIPGLKVVMPSTPSEAKGLLIESIQDDSPVLFIEHRWLHHIRGHVPEAPYSIPLGKARIARPGKDITIAAISHTVIDSLRAAESLAETGIDAEVLDLRCAKPLDQATLLDSVAKTARILVVDQSWQTCGLGAEILAVIAESGISLSSTPQRLSLPDCPCPTSHGLSRYFYIQPWDIDNKVRQMMKVPSTNDAYWEKAKTAQLDVPDTSFTGPF